jgi:putative copper resistance protein D
VNGALLAHGDGDLPPPLGPAAVFTETDLLTPVTPVLVAAGLLYVWGVVRLRRRGDRWPAGRTVTFLLGLVALGTVTVGGLAAYERVLLSAHMVQHMVLSMIAPIFLALGAPVSLALRALPRHGAAGRPRRILLAVLHSWPARVLTFPIVAYGIFVASPFALYFSGLYRASLTSDVLHDVVHVHFLVAGCLFLWPLIGLDPLPGRMPYPLRALLVFLSTPFHTVLGLTVMQGADLIGGDWYPRLNLGWADPVADQRLAGGILWAAGEAIAVAMLAALVVQWMRQSEREARRIDRALDRAEELDRAAELDRAEEHGAEEHGAEEGPDGGTAHAPGSGRDPGAAATHDRTGGSGDRGRSALAARVRSAGSQEAGAP